MAPTVTLNFAADVSQLRRGVDMATAMTGGLASGAIAAVGALAAVPVLIAGIGIAAAAQNEQVKASFTGLKEHVVAQTQAMAAPIVPVLIGIADKARAAFDSIGPTLSNMFVVVAPMIDRVATALMSLVTGSLPGLNTALTASRPVVDAIALGFEKMGPAISQMFTNISGGAPGAASAITMIFDAVNWLLPVIGNVVAFTAQWSHILIPLAGVMLGFSITLRLVQAGMAAYAAIMAAVRIATAAWAGVQWLLNAAMLANPIGIVIAIVVALVAAIIYAWNNCETFRNVVKAVWEGIKSAFNAGVNFVKGLLNWFGQLPGLFSGWFNSAKTVAIGALQMMLSFIGSIPGRILGLLGNLGGLLAGAGRSLIMGLWNGIVTTFNWVVGQVRGLMGSLRNLFPFSPAKDGPFSGRGYTLYSGQAMATDFAKGIVSGTPDILSAANSAMNAASSPFDSSFNVASARPAMGGNSGGGVTVNFSGNTSDALANLIMGMIRTGKIQIAAG